jgi:hypothetical protein
MAVEAGVPPGAGSAALVTGATSGSGEGWSVIGWDVAPGTDPRVSWARVDVSDRTGQ